MPQETTLIKKTCIFDSFTEINPFQSSNIYGVYTPHPSMRLNTKIISENMEYAYIPRNYIL